MAVKPRFASPSWFLHLHSYSSTALARSGDGDINSHQRSEEVANLGGTDRVEWGQNAWCQPCGCCLVSLHRKLYLIDVLRCMDGTVGLPVIASYVVYNEGAASLSTTASSISTICLNDSNSTPLWFLSNMPISDMMPSEPLPFIPRALATTLGAIIFQAGVSAYAMPVNFTRTFGIPREEPVNPWVYAFAARELSLGVALLSSAARKEWHSVGVIGAAMSICGVTDGVLDGNYGGGWRRAWKTHLIPTILFAPVSWYLLTH